MASLFTLVSWGVTVAGGLSTLQKGAELLALSNEDFSPVNEKEIHIKVDPITTLVTTALLKFKEPGTRIAKSGFRVISQEPKDYSIGYGINLTGIVRTVSGHSREDLALIERAITAAALFYNPQNDSEVKSLFTQARDGLDALKITYGNVKSKTTCAAIDTWQNLIDYSCTTGLETEKKFSELSNKIKTLWDSAEIHTINCHLKIAAQNFNVSDERAQRKCRTHISAIETMLNGKTEELELFFKN